MTIFSDSDADRRRVEMHSYLADAEQLARYRTLTPLQRLRWLDEARRFTLLARAAMRRSALDAAAASEKTESSTSAP